MQLSRIKHGYLTLALFDMGKSVSESVSLNFSDDLSLSLSLDDSFKPACHFLYHLSVPITSGKGLSTYDSFTLNTKLKKKVVSHVFRQKNTINTSVFPCHLHYR